MIDTLHIAIIHAPEIILATRHTKQLLQDQVVGCWLECFFGMVLKMPIFQALRDFWEG